MDNKGNKNNQNNNNKNGMTILIFILVALIVLFIASIISNGISKMTNQEISYSEFKKMVEEDKVDSVEFNSGRINIVPKTENGKMPLITYYAIQLSNDDSLYPLLEEHKVDYRGIPASTATAILYNILSIAIPIVILWIALGFIMRRMGGGGGVMGVGKSTAKVYVEKQTGVTFKDVAGQDEAKESLQEVVDFLHNPKKYTDIGAKLPKGALLVGPPGTGKTLLAKAVAGEAKVPFFSLAGSDFVEMFVGVGASRVRDLFKEAQKQAPCIIFIDEIDAIGKSRDTRYGGNDEREQTLNQLLAEMDGFDTSKGLLILAATNRPEVLDKALLRPGRFDRRIIVDKPDLKGRVETLKVHAKNVLMDDSVDLDAIALATSGAVGSDLANMINEAAINAVKHSRKYVNQSDLFESVEVVIAGKEKKDRIMRPKEKKMVAYHEVGHALATALQKDAEPVQKITIVPRTMGALGYTMQVPEEEKFLMTKKELMAHLVTYMGGRAAEEIVFDSVTTGASNDIEQATKIARSMVTQYGMSEKFGLIGLATVENQYLDGRASLNCGEETAAQIDKEVMKILAESYETAKRLLEENRGILDEISEYLYENETITGKEFMKIFRRLKGLPEEEEGDNKEDSIALKKSDWSKDSQNREDFTVKQSENSEHEAPAALGPKQEKEPETKKAQSEEGMLTEASELPQAPEQAEMDLNELPDSGQEAAAEEAATQPDTNEPENNRFQNSLQEEEYSEELVKEDAWAVDITEQKGFASETEYSMSKPLQSEQELPQKTVLETVQDSLKENDEEPIMVDTLDIPLEEIMSAVTEQEEIEDDTEPEIWEEIPDDSEPEILKEAEEQRFDDSELPSVTEPQDINKAKAELQLEAEVQSEPVEEMGQEPENRAEENQAEQEAVCIKDGNDGNQAYEQVRPEQAEKKPVMEITVQEEEPAEQEEIQEPPRPLSAIEMLKRMTESKSEED